MVPLLGRDGLLLLLAKFLRTFVYGILIVALAFYLPGIGFTTIQIGIVITVALLGGVVSTLLVVFLADRYGRRKSLSILSLATALTGLTLAATSEFWLIALGLFVGSVSLTGGETGPFLSIEQSVVPQISSEAERNHAFSLYNFIGYLGFSLGSLANAIPGIVEQNLGVSVRGSYLPIFLLLALVGVVLAITYQLLGLRVEAVPSTIGSRLSIPKTYHRIVLKLSVLFGVDAFAGGFVLQSVISLWFRLSFQADKATVGEIIALGQVVTAFSFFLAGRAANRFGLLNTMVFSHIASNLFLASLAFAPGLSVAVGLYCARQSLSQMDVPTRQAYTMAIVPVEARTPTAGVTTLSRNITQSISPLLAGYFQAIPGLLGAPFLLGGGIKIAYDLLLYRSFRHITPPNPNNKSSTARCP